MLLIQTYSDDTIFPDRHNARSGFRFVNKVQRDGVYAMTFIRRSLVAFSLEDMPQMSTARGARNLNACHPKGTIFVAVHRAGYSVEECRPSAPAVELRGRFVKRGAASSAGEDALAFEVLILARACGFSALLSENAELFRGEDCPPLSIVLSLAGTTHSWTAVMKVA